ncbi:MAG: hypothetical protein WC522_06150 [Candidatus Omnitrophota bacterium]
MIRAIKCAMVLGIISCLFLDIEIADAKRGIPAAPTPVIYKGIKFIAVDWPKHENVLGRDSDVWYVEGWDIEKNKKVWEKEAYSIAIDKFLEYDVQMVFITSLDIENSKLIVTNERGKKYYIEIPLNILKQ